MGERTGWEEIPQGPCYVAGCGRPLSERRSIPKSCDFHYDGLRTAYDAAMEENEMWEYIKEHREGG